ncbi:MAG: hypothetical protein LBD04_10570, partial [Synergistaceae bacterium]|nr:hypothetical protein [Synergistaceae bacterium]
MSPECRDNLVQIGRVLVFVIFAGAFLSYGHVGFAFRAPNITHLFGPSGYKAIFINAVFQSKLYQDSMVMID